MARQHASWEQIVEGLDRIAQVATVSADGEPHVARVAPVREGTMLWIFTRASSAKARNVAASGRMALLWASGAEVYVWGRAELIDDPVDKARLWARHDLAFDPAGFFGSVDDPDFVLVRVEAERALRMTAAGPARWLAAGG